MANGKKSFVLYCDLIHTIEKMPDEKAGQLFKHILAYVNDQNPTTNDLIIELTFEPIKQQLKRDLQKWETEIKPKRSESGRLGGIKSGEARRSKTKQNEANASNAKQNEANEAVNVNVNVNDSNIPTIDLFLEYAKTITDIYKPTLDYAIKSKYQSWVENGWKDGHDKEIKNWKNTLRNTLPYLKELPKPVEELKIGEVFQPKINFY